MSIPWQRTMVASTMLGVNLIGLTGTVCGNSPSQEQTDPVTPWQARDQFERLHGDHDKNTAHAAASVVANTPSMDGRRRLFLRSASSLFAPLTEKEGIKQVLNQDRYGIDEARARRILQTSCAEGDPFTITSSAFPSLEGCVLDSGFVSEDDRTVYNSSSAVVWSVPFSSTTTDSSEASWVVYEIISSSDMDFYCVSLETSIDLPYPVEATWICDVDGDGEPEFPTSSEFSTSCGCSTTTDIDTGTTDSPGSVTCNEGQAFHITSTAVPEAASCYSDTGLSFEDEVAYSDTGTTDLPQNVVQAFANGETGAPDVRWIVGYLTSETTSMEDILYCYSGSQAIGVHPVDVTSWYCYTDSTDEAEFVTSEEFSISCGCSSDPPAPIASPTLAPITVELSPAPIANIATEMPTVKPRSIPEEPATRSPMVTTLEPSAVSRGVVSSEIPFPDTMSTTEPVLTTDHSPAPTENIATEMPTVEPTSIPGVPATSSPMVTTMEPPADSRGVASSGSPSPGIMSTTEPVLTTDLSPAPTANVVTELPTVKPTPLPEAPATPSPMMTTLEPSAVSRGVVSSGSPSPAIISTAGPVSRTDLSPAPFSVSPSSPNATTSLSPTASLFSSDSEMTMAPSSAAGSLEGEEPDVGSGQLVATLSTFTIIVGASFAVTLVDFAGW